MTEIERIHRQARECDRRIQRLLRLEEGDEDLAGAAEQSRALVGRIEALRAREWRRRRERRDAAADYG